MTPSSVAPAMPVYLIAPRGPSSQSALKIEWRHPVFQEHARQEGTGSQAVEARRRLPSREAYLRIAGEDRRPLLVLRECLTCSGTDDALLTREADNEKTMLLSRWFHCVKLGPNVLDEDHPFGALFPGESPAHLFVSRWDGSGRLDLQGDQSRTELWAVMERLLASDYEDSSRKPLKELFRILDRFDELDREIAALEARLDEAIEKSGPDSSKAKKYGRSLERARAELVALEERAQAVSRLDLKPGEEEGHGQASTPRAG